MSWEDIHLLYYYSSVINSICFIFYWTSVEIFHKNKTGMCFPFPSILHLSSAYFYLHDTSLRPGFTHSPYMCWHMKCLLVIFSSDLPFMVSTNFTFSQRFYDKVIICYIQLGASHWIFINTWPMSNTTICFTSMTMLLTERFHGKDTENGKFFLSLEARENINTEN